MPRRWYKRPQRRQIGIGSADASSAELAVGWEDADLTAALADLAARVPDPDRHQGLSAAGSDITGTAWPAGPVPVTIQREGKVCPARPGIIL